MTPAPKPEPLLPCPTPLGLMSAYDFRDEILALNGIEEAKMPEDDFHELLRMIEARDVQLSQAKGEERNKAAREGWFRALVMYVDLDAEGNPEYIEAANQRWLLSVAAPQASGEGE